VFAYTVKVQGTMFLWGGRNVRAKLRSDLQLVFRVAEGDEPVRFGRFADGQETELGILGAGECYSLSVTDISGVFAATVAPLDTRVECALVPGKG
jgi:hypothetical protein